MAEADWKYLQYNVENGQKRTSDGPSGGASSLSDLDDTNISNPSDGQMLGYDGTEGKWKNVAAPTGSVADVTLDGNSVVNGQGVAALTTPNVNDLKDTNISSPSDGQTLQYNATNQKWENKTPSGGGGNVDDVKVNGTSVVTNKVANIKSYKEVTQAEYEALPDTKLSDDVLYAIKDSNGAAGFPPLIYSDEEREIGVWRDGKPLYQKTYSVNLTISGGTWADTGIPKGDIDRIVRTEINDANNSYGYASASIDHSNVWICPSLSNQKIITLWYTKSTDTAGSGNWATTGGFTHHYSETEQVVGTWVDGKTIYEKTIIVNRASTTNVDLTDLNIDKVLFYKGSVIETQDNMPPLGYSSSAQDFAFAYYSKYQTPLKLVLPYAGNYNAGTWNIVIQYTKNTT